MSIDARVTAISKELGEDKPIKLYLEDRPGGGPAGQETLTILNTGVIKETKYWAIYLCRLIGCDIWGGAGEIMLGDTVFAQRHGYTGILLVGNWFEIIQTHRETI